MAQRPSLPAAAAALTMGALARLDEATALRVGALLGRSYARLDVGRVRDARINLRIAFPEWSDEERARVLLGSLENLGRSVAEFARTASLSAEELRGRVDVEGIEHLEAAQEKSPTGGVVAVTAHFGNWELLASAMTAYGLPILVIHRARDDEDLDALIFAQRRHAGTELAARGSAARQALGALREGKILAMTLDQNAPRREGVFVPFFGRLACTRDAPARIAMRTGAPVVPAFLFRRGTGARHVCSFRPALESAEVGDDRGAAARETTARMSAAVEAAVRESPDQWSWTHRRWRTQPVGEPRPYPSRRRSRFHG